jgi:antitoxin VapB
MLDLSKETETLARRLAEAQHLSVDAAIRLALERQAAGGVAETGRKHHRMTIEEMLAVGAEIAAMPVIDPRSSQEIMDDLGTL